MHGLAEGALVLDRIGQPVEFGAGAVLDELPPEIDDALRILRRPRAGQALAHHQGQRIFERGVGAIVDLGVISAAVAIFEHRAEIGRDAFHAPRANGFHARLFNGFEDAARSRALRRDAAVDLVVVTRKPQRQRIGMPAHDRGLARIQFARRLGQARLGAFARADHGGAIGGEGHLKTGRARHRAHAGGDRALERFLRGFLGRGRLTV